MTATATTTTTKRHPIRGFLYGIFFGLGLAMIVIGQKWAALGTWPPFLVFLIGLVAATLWSTFGPAKKPKGAPPIDEVADDVPPPPEDAPVAAEEEAFVGEESAAVEESDDTETTAAGDGPADDEE